MQPPGPGASFQEILEFLIALLQGVFDFFFGGRMM